MSASVLVPLTEVANRYSSIQGLRNYEVADYGSHEGGTSTLLTDAPIGGYSGPLQAGISVDQVAADQIGRGTPISSLQLGLDEPGIFENGNSGLYVNHVSWGPDNNPLTKTTDPQQLYLRIFAGSDPVATAVNLSQRRSILDAVLERANDLEKRLGVDDKRKLDQYTTSVRAFEEQLIRLNEGPTCPTVSPPSEGGPFHQRYRAMWDLTILALQCDMTRLVSFMAGPSTALTVYRHLDHAQTHHDLSHARSADGMASFVELHAWHMGQLARTIAEMQEIPEPGGDLLSNTAITICSEFGDPNVHDASTLTMILAGGENGGIRQGQHRRYNSIPHSNYLRSMLDFVGVPSASFGNNATGSLDLS